MKVVTLKLRDFCKYAMNCLEPMQEILPSVNAQDKLAIKYYRGKVHCDAPAPTSTNAD